jgi:hypothetical protein
MGILIDDNLGGFKVPNSDLRSRAHLGCAYWEREPNSRQLPALTRGL